MSLFDPFNLRKKAKDKSVDLIKTGTSKAIGHAKAKVSATPQNAVYPVQSWDIHRDAIKTVLQQSSAWDNAEAWLKTHKRKLYKYKFLDCPAEIVKEPDNPYDKNALAVVVDGEKIGYISRDDNLNVGELLKKHVIESIIATINGGAYKYIDDDGEVAKVNDDFRVKVSIRYY